MQVTIDRFEGNYAIVELSEGMFVNLPRILVPDAKEGDIIDISIDIDKTEARKKRIENLQNNLFED